MSRHMQHNSRFLFALAAFLAVSALGSGRAAAQTITEIIDATGDGTGNGLEEPEGIAVDAAGNAYVTGRITNNAFKITPAGVITEIIDATGDGGGNACARSGLRVSTRGCDAGHGATGGTSPFEDGVASAREVSPAAATWTFSSAVLGPAVFRRPRFADCCSDF